MSIISHLLSIRTSTYLTRSLLRSTSLLTQYRLSSTLPPSSKTTTNSTLPNELPLSEKKKAKYNISWKSK
jgi:hypothetical protein